MFLTRPDKNVMIETFESNLYRRLVLESCGFSPTRRPLMIQAPGPLQGVCNLLAIAFASCRLEDLVSLVLMLVSYASLPLPLNRDKKLILNIAA